MMEVIGTECEGRESARMWESSSAVRPSEAVIPFVYLSVLRG